MYKCKSKKEGRDKGITLVALVVTIVVLLILAGITITMLFSENGIIKKAQEAANKTADDKSNTEGGINNLTNQMLGALGEKENEEEEEGKVPIGTLYENFVAKTDDGEDINVPIPGGYKVVPNSENTNNINDGIVIQDGLGNQFVWVPVNDEQLTRMYDATNKRGKLYDFGSQVWDDSTFAYVWTPYETPQIKEYSSDGNREPDIISGFDGSDATEDSSYFKTSISENMPGAEFKTQLQGEFDNMIKSVEHYKGFYIGRYETGSLISSNAINVPKVQKGIAVRPANGAWYNQYVQTKNLSKMKGASDNYVDNPNVSASMIWGCQWDRTLEWIAQTNLTEDGKPNYSLLTNSSTWGNYYNYKTATGDTSTESGKILPSGTNSNWQKNNIFDLAGNVEEWTIEANSTSYRVSRGGYGLAIGSVNPAFYRNDVGVTVNSERNGSRAMLYINLNAAS